MTIDDAVALYQQRQARQAHPAGSFDRAGRWHPDETETCDCCASVRSPSRRFPYSLMQHCRTIKHIAQLAGVSESDLRAAIRVGVDTELL